MAKLKVLNLKKVTSGIRRDITKALRDKEFRDGIGDIVVNEVKETTLGSAKDGTLAWRKYLEKGNATDPKYNRNKIKALFTGELLNDLRNNVRLDLSSGGASFTIEHTDKKHKKYKKPNGKPTKGIAQTYKAIQGFLEELGYFYIRNAKNSAKIEKKVRDFIQEMLFKKLK